jgi:hypothetical protein
MLPFIVCFAWRGCPHLARICRNEGELRFEPISALAPDTGGFAGDLPRPGRNPALPRGECADGRAGLRPHCFAEPAFALRGAAAWDVSPFGGDWPSRKAKLRFEPNRAFCLESGGFASDSLRSSNGDISAARQQTAPSPSGTHGRPQRPPFMGGFCALFVPARRF